MSDDPLLAVEGVDLSFGGVAALSDMCLEVCAGEVVGLVGPNGAGNTTLINVVTGYYRPDSGAVRFAGRDIVGLPPHDLAEVGIARTFQGLQLFEGTSVLDNVLLGRHTAFHAPYLRMWGARRREEREQRRVASDLLDLLGLAELADEDVSLLPYGTRRRVEIARALALEPKLLLLDEPTAGMTAPESAEVADVIRLVADEGTAVLLIDHNLKLVGDACPRTCVMVNGHALVTGDTAEVFAMADVREAYIGNRRRGVSDVA